LKDLGDCERMFFSQVNFRAGRSCIFAASLWLLFQGLLFQGVAKAEISPSQVLVLYNADWKEDGFLTEKGQDSKEVAEYYQKMHTDPVSGEKPYLLGLKCKHGSALHLNEAHIQEASRDNSSGVVFRRGDKAIESAGELRDTRAVEFTLPKKEGARWEAASLKIVLKPNYGKEIAVVESGKSLLGPGVEFGDNEKFTVRFNGRAAALGNSFTAKASCKDSEGKESRWEAEFRDYMDVSCSRTGPDGIRDDEKYLQDVEYQVMDFLEDQANVRPGGVLLKDHILFIVVCYGLPKTAAATYGIARGITERSSDHGTDIDLGQRLQLIYYDIEGALGFSPRPRLFKTKDAFSGYFFRAPQVLPLMIKGCNPFMHPDIYKAKKGDLRKLADPVEFSPENRRRFPGRRLFFSSRVDGPAALDAKRLIDSAVYASRYAGPEMARTDAPLTKTAVAAKKYLSQQPAWQFLLNAGYKRLRFDGGRLLRFLSLEPGTGFFNEDYVFLPGGVSATVISHNGWNRDAAEIYEDLRRGASATAGAARVYQGAPHIHDKSWWDDEIFYPFLLRGKTVGEVLLMNQGHLEWITAFVADPLMRISQNPQRDETPPNPAAESPVEILKGTGPGGKAGIWARVKLVNDPSAPELAQMRLTSESGKTATDEVFRSSPFAYLGQKPEACGDWKIELIDPYGNGSSAGLTVPCN